jgi:hypothetical protein
MLNCFLNKQGEVTIQVATLENAEVFTVKL